MTTNSGISIVKRRLRANPPGMRQALGLWTWVIFGSLALGSCDKMDEWARKQSQGGVLSSEEKLPKWEKEIQDLHGDIRECLQDSDRIGLIHRKMAKEHAKRKNYIKAGQHYNKAIEHGQTSATVYHEAATVWATRARQEKKAQNSKKALELGQKALVFYNKALNKDESRLSSRFGRALLLYYIMGQEKEAVQTLQRLQNEAPKNDRVLFALGRIFFEQESYDRALSYYHKLLKILPEGSERAKKVESNIQQILIRQKKNTP